jgi:hypothetical protein
MLDVMLHVGRLLLVTDVQKIRLILKQDFVLALVVMVYMKESFLNSVDQGLLAIPKRNVMI